MRDVSLIDATFAGCPLFAAPNYDPKLFFNAPAGVPHAEQVFFSFIQQKTIMFTPPLPADEALGEFFAAQAGPVWQFTTGLIDYLRHFSAAPEALELMHQAQVDLNVMRFVFAYHCMDGDFVKLADFFVPEEITYQQSHLRDVLANYVKHLPDNAFNQFLQSQPSLLNMLFYLFVPFLRVLHWDESVTVNSQLDANDFLNQNVLDFLDNLPVVQRVSADPAQVPDLLLTTPEDASVAASATTVFDWHIDATEADYYRLFHTVLDLYHAKTLPDPPDSPDTNKEV